jgi:hypothetical protein
MPLGTHLLQLLELGQGMGCQKAAFHLRISVLGHRAAHQVGDGADRDLWQGGQNVVIPRLFIGDVPQLELCLGYTEPGLRSGQPEGRQLHSRGRRSGRLRGGGISLHAEKL